MKEMKGGGREFLHHIQVSFLLSWSYAKITFGVGPVKAEKHHNLMRFLSLLTSLWPN